MIEDTLRPPSQANEEEEESKLNEAQPLLGEIDMRTFQSIPTNITHPPGSLGNPWFTDFGQNKEHSLNLYSNESLVKLNRPMVVAIALGY
jgi:hypothetical protein